MIIPKFTNETAIYQADNGKYQWSCPSFTLPIFRTEVKSVLFINESSKNPENTIKMELQRAAPGPNGSTNWIVETGTTGLQGDYTPSISPITGEYSPTVQGGLVNQGTELLRWFIESDHPINFTLADDL